MDKYRTMLRNLGETLYGKRWLRPMANDISEISLSLLAQMTDDSLEKSVTPKTRAALVRFIQERRAYESERYTRVIELLAEAELLYRD